MLIAQFQMSFPYPETEACDVSTIRLVLHSDSGGQSRTIAIDHRDIVFKGQVSTKSIVLSLPNALVL